MKYQAPESSLSVSRDHYVMHPSPGLCNDFCLVLTFLASRSFFQPRQGNVTVSIVSKLSERYRRDK